MPTCTSIVLTTTLTSVKSIQHKALPVFTLNRADPLPLQRQIYDGFRTAILRGHLRPGEQILSSR
jgi:hypothetical protein